MGSGASSSFQATKDLPISSTDTLYDNTSQISDRSDESGEGVGDELVMNSCIHAINCEANFFVAVPTLCEIEKSVIVVDCEGRTKRVVADSVLLDEYLSKNLTCI